MTWTDDKDLIMLTAIAGEGVFDTKAGSRERGSSWQAVADCLNCHESHKFTANQRSVRDRFNTLAKKVKSKLSKEERESGGGESELSESDKLVEELIILSEESEKRSEDQSEAKREAVANEKKQALEMRDRALERFGETRKRNEEQKAEEKKAVTKRRRSGGDTLEWLRERAEADSEIKKQEIAEKREERVTQQNYIREMEAMRQQQNEQVTLLQQQMLHFVQQEQQKQQQYQQQQQQQQQFTMLQQQMLAMFQQQQQQTQALLAFLQKKD